MTDLPKITVVQTVYETHWEDYDNWIGRAHYADIETAKAYAVADWWADERLPDWFLKEHGWNEDELLENREPPPTEWVGTCFGRHLELRLDGNATGLEILVHQVYGVES